VKITRLVLDDCPTLGKHGAWQFTDGTRSETFHSPMEAALALIEGIASGRTAALDRTGAAKILKILSTFTERQTKLEIPAGMIVAIAAELTSEGTARPNRKTDPNLN
jgi:hypothetical protein